MRIRDYLSPKFISAFFGFTFLSLLLFPVLGKAQEACTCENTGDSICSQQGFEISLVKFDVDALNGVSNWYYEVCNGKTLNPDGSPVCTTEPFRDLSHIDIDLPDLGADIAGCLNEGAQMTLSQVVAPGETPPANLSCSVSFQDPSCDIFGNSGEDYVAKCDVTGDSNLDSGECVTMKLAIAGEMPALGAGAAMTVTKAGRECGRDCILGPSCEPCTPPPNDECLTRTPGFWGTHPQVTDEFLPITVCGKPLETVMSGTCNSVSEALCVSPGKEGNKALDRNPAYASLVRSLAAAKLNLAASAYYGGNCGEEISARIAECESLYCNANQASISSSGCIEDLDAFNNSQDSFAYTPIPFDRPGPADPAYCSASRGDGIVIGKGSCH